MRGAPLLLTIEEMIFGKVEEIIYCDFYVARQRNVDDMKESRVSKKSNNQTLCCQGSETLVLIQNLKTPISHFVYLH